MPVHANDVLREVRATEQGVQGFNRRVGVKITGGVATMWCAYLFAAIALISLPQALQLTFAGRGFHPLPIVTWVAQTFLQLVLLSVILFGQNLLSEKADARAEATFRNTADAEARLDAIIEALGKRGEESARLEKQSSEILERLGALPGASASS
jgi:hypothetical protein